MVSAFAFFGLSFVLAGVIFWFIAAERRRQAKALDRRLAAYDREAIRKERHLPIAPPDFMEPLFAQADIEVTRKALLNAAISFGVLSLITLLWLGPVAALIVVLSIPLLAYVWLLRRAGKYIDNLIEGLPHYVDAVRQLLNVGASLPQALVRALNDAPPDVRRYFDPAGRRIEMGVPVDEAMEHLAERIRVPEVAMFSAAIKTQLRFGGAITTVLANLSQLLRDRIRIKRDLKAATAEARVSAKVLIGMPLIAMALLMVSNPEYPHFFLTDPRGQNMAIIAIVLQVMGIIVLKRQMRLEF